MEDGVWVRGDAEGAIGTGKKGVLGGRRCRRKFSKMVAYVTEAWFISKRDAWNKDRGYQGNWILLTCSTVVSVAS